MSKTLTYTGPHERLAQVGSTSVDVGRGETVELDDELADTLLEQAPDDWKVKKSGGAKKAAAKSTTEENDAS